MFLGLPGYFWKGLGGDVRLVLGSTFTCKVPYGTSCGEIPIFLEMIGDCLVL